MACPSAHRISTSDLIKSGVATLPLSTSARNLVDGTIEAGYEFFGRSLRYKQRFAVSDRNSGFRELGEEYSQSADRPDLNESYSVWARARRDEARPPSPRLDGLLLEWQLMLAPAVARLLADVAELIGGHRMEAPSSDFTPYSYAQMNFYKHHAGSDKRTFLQDLHEDGHLLTVITSDGPGLEIVASEKGGEPQPVSPAPGALLAMAGSALTAVSGGTIPAAYHRVRNLDLPERVSLMYFVNPNLHAPIYAWTDRDRVHDLAPAIRNKPLDFGLPPVPS